MRSPSPYLRLTSAILATLALGCSGDDSRGSASSTSMTASTSVTDASTTSSTLGGSASESASGSASEASASASEGTTTTTTTTSSGGPTAGMSDSSTTTTGSFSSSSTSTPSGSASSSSTGDPTGGRGEVCDDLREVDFGDCATPLGWIFDGEACVPLSGCDCGANCDAVFLEPSECADACAAIGECRKDLLLGKGIIEGPYGLGDFCDSFSICGDTSMSVPDLLPSAQCIEDGNYPCNGELSCSVDSTEPMLTEDQLEKLCAASLLPGVNLVACVVLGP